MIITIARQCGCMGDQIGKALAEKYYRELSFYSCTVSNFEQYTLAAFMNAGAFEKHINRLRNYYQHKRDLILSTFSESLWENILRSVKRIQVCIS